MTADTTTNESNLVNLNLDLIDDEIQCSRNQPTVEPEEQFVSRISQTVEEGPIPCRQLSTQHSVNYASPIGPMEHILEPEPPSAPNVVASRQPEASMPALFQSLSKDNDLEAQLEGIPLS